MSAANRVGISPQRLRRLLHGPRLARPSFDRLRTRPLGRDDTVSRPMHYAPMGDYGYFTYMLASAACGTLYVGVTNDLIGRVWEHRNDRAPGFTKRYRVKRLVWFEQHGEIGDAIRREKAIKRWRRDWKIALIEAENPHWEDLYPKLLKAGWFALRS